MEKTIKTATLGIAEEYRKMEVGDSVRFPLPPYNYNSIRVAPTTTLMAERLEGRRWKTEIDNESRSVIVTRTA